MTDISDFKGRTAFVTGAASGIGAATARAFAKAGAAVVLADIQAGAGEGIAETIRVGGGRAQFVRCDMRKEAEIEAAIARTVEEFGGIDVAFNNAGVEGAQAATADCTNDNWNFVMEVNLRAVWWCMKHEIPRMLEGGGGAIVNCASIAGLVGFPNIPAYVASKHGVIGLTKTAALEYADRNIRVNAVCPGVIQTPMIDRFVKADPAMREGLLASEPVGRLGTPEEIASGVVWLCSPGASFTTGHPLVVDGGWVAR